MLRSVITLPEDLAAESLTFDEPGNAVWAATTRGRLVTVRLLDRRVRTLGAGYRHPVGVVPLHDGLLVAVVERRGRVWLASRETASRSRARLVTDLPGRALVARRHPDPGRVLVLTTGEAPGGDEDPALFSLDVRAGTTEVVASGLTDARTFVVDEARRELAVLSVTPVGARQLTVMGLDDGAITSVIDVALALDAILTSPDAAEHAVVGAFADDTSPGRLAHQRFDGSVGAILDVGRPVASLTRWGSLVLVGSGADVTALEWNLDEGDLGVEAPLGPLSVNGYTRLAVDLAAAGLTRDQVDFTVREGPEAGSVSAGVEPAAADGRQPVVLLAGIRPGEYHVEAWRRADGARLARRRFRVIAGWPDEIVGPPVAVTGPHQSYHLMSWGGGGAGPGYLFPAPPLWRVAVFLVATKDRRWGALEGAAKAEWRDKVVGGGDSVKRFYEEVSYGNMTVQLVGDRVLGPVDLEEGWGDVFEPKKGGGLDGGWMSKPGGRTILAGAISAWMADQPDGASMMALADAIAIVVRSATDAPTTVGTAPPIPTQYVWGHAARDMDYWRKSASTFTQGSKPSTIMTDVYPAGLAVKPVLQHTLSHELGHTLGLEDLYDARNDFPAEINARSPADADLMASTRPLPHFSIANRMRLGWIKPAWLRRFDFSLSPSGGTVALHAIERLSPAGPPPGRVAGIEVPIADGWSYLFELRRRQPGQVGDQELNRLSASEFLVLGTDLRVSGGESARPPILLLPEDADGDGPLLDVAGEDYRDSDVTNPARMHDFALVVQAMGDPDGDGARVRVDYVAAHRPQLVIRPAPGRGHFKSPDIDLVGPFGMAVSGVVKGAVNAIRITVHNLGSLPAGDVRIHVKWLPFTLSSGDWRDVPDPPPFAVPALGSASLVVPWDLPASVKVGDDEAQHFCVRVEIERYRDAAHPDHDEVVVFDNWAQSNFDSAPIGFGSPSDRVRTVATLTNPLGREATYQLVADQSGDGYRVYVGHAWCRLGPGQTRAVELAYESLADDPVHGPDFARHRERITSRATHVAVTSWLVPEATECDTPREWWGVSLDLRAGRRAWIEHVQRDGELVTARVRASRDGTTVDVTSGAVHLAAWPAERPHRISVTQGLIRLDGTARVLLHAETLRDIAAGSRILALLARPADTEFARALLGPVRLA